MTAEETTALNIAVAKALGAKAEYQDGWVCTQPDGSQPTKAGWVIFADWCDPTQIYSMEEDAWREFTGISIYDRNPHQYTTDPTAILALLDEIRRRWGVVEIKRGPFPGQVTCAIFTEVDGDRVDGWRGSAVGTTTGEAACRAFVGVCEDKEGK